MRACSLSSPFTQRCTPEIASLIFSCMRRVQAWDASIVAAGYQGRESTANGMVLITVLLCTLVRGAKLQEAKVGTALMFPAARLLVTCTTYNC